MLTTLYHLFPSTIHPMVVHFTIAFIYLTAVAGLVGLALRKDPFFERLYFYLGLLSILATIAAGVAGVISEYYVQVGPTVGRILETHQHDGELTGILLLVATAAQLWWRMSGKRTVFLLSLVFTVGATILVSVTGHLGGVMVYSHGLGVHR